MSLVTNFYMSSWPLIRISFLSYSYGKVVESKDLSKASKKDIAAIFGKPTKSSETLVPEDSSEKKSLYNLYDFKYMSKFVSDWYLKQMLPVSVLPRRNVPFAS